jgi:homoprotocatechuate degradation regulator HpaR
LPAFRDTLPMILNVTLDGVMPVYRELFARHGLTEQQWRCLRVLWAEGEVTTTELSRQTLLPAPSLVGILDRLEKKELVARHRSDRDRRKVHVTATDEGRALHQRVIPELEHVHAKVTGAVTPAEWDAMRATLMKITREMSGQTLDGLLARTETA